MRSDDAADDEDEPGPRAGGPAVDADDDDDDDDDVSSTAVLHFLWRILSVHLRPCWGRAGLVLVLGLAAQAFDTIFPLALTALVDRALGPRDARMLALVIGGSVALYLIAAAGTVAMHHQSALVGARMLNGLRLRLFTHLQRLPASFHARTRTSDVLASFQNDLMAIEFASMYSVVQVAQYLLGLIASVGVAFVLDWRMALVLLVAIPLMVLAPKKFADGAMGAGYERKRAELGVQNTVAEYVNAHGVVRAFGLERLAVARFGAQLDEFQRRVHRANFLQLMVFGATGASRMLAQLLVLAIGGALCWRGELSVGRLLGMAAVLGAVGEAMSWLSDAFSEMIPAIPSLERIERLLDEPITVAERPGAVALGPLSRGVALEGVSFGYGAEPLLRGLDLELAADRRFAVVGRSGSGKSTLLGLLTRSWDPQAGRVTFDGHDLRDVTLESLRGQCALVPQDTFLFDTSIRENIRIGRPGASDADVERAARDAEVHEAILGLPGGYDAPAGERGGLLSGGQRQRVAIARALLRDPRLLLLDEATSALDPATERALHETLRRVGRGRAVVNVTHRLASAADADHIVVLDGGRVAEQGAHEALLAQGGLYAGLWRQQSGFSVSADGHDAEVRPDRLRALPLLAGVDEASLADLSRQFVPEFHERDRVVVEEGAAGDRFFIIVRGRVAVTRRGPDGRPVRVDTFQDGDWFGEIALLEDVPRTATVRTELPTLLLSLQRRQFRQMLERQPALRQAVEAAAAARRAAPVPTLEQPGAPTT